MNFKMLKDSKVFCSNKKNEKEKRFCFSGNKNQFTLVEVIIVLGIMALLLSITMPAFTSMIKGAGVEGGVRNLSQTLKLARTYAVSNNSYVAVLMPMVNNTPTQAASGLGDSLYNNAYRVCTVNKLGPNSYSFKRWVAGEMWEYLPTGTCLLDIDGVVLVGKVDYSDIGGNPITTEASGFYTAGIVFTSSGKATRGASLKIGEGAVQGEELIVTNPDAKAYKSISVGEFTGRVSID